MPPRPLFRPKRPLRRRLVGSALFILSALVMAAVGVLAFLTWLQAQLSDFERAPVALALWVLAALFFGVTAAAILIDEWRHRSTRPERP